MNSFINSNNTIISNEINIDTNSSAENNLNTHFIDNTKLNNPIDKEKMCLEEFDNDFNDFGIQYVKYNYNTTLKRNNTTDPKFDGSGINYFLYKHNYCMTKENTQTCDEKMYTLKQKDFYKSEEKSFNDININYSVGEIDESPKYNLQETHLESVEFEIKTDHFIDNKSICTISDEEEPKLDVIPISSESFIDDSNSCMYHSSDFEFIDEGEAKKDGLIMNYSSQTKTQTINNDVKTIEISKESSSQELFLDDFNMSIENIEHEIPQDTNYMSMFERNIPYPVRCMENKSICNNCKLTEYQDVGFNKNIYDREKVEKHVIDEVNESKNKILCMYPSENRRILKSYLKIESYL